MPFGRSRRAPRGLETGHDLLLQSLRRDLARSSGHPCPLPHLPRRCRDVVPSAVRSSRHGSSHRPRTCRARRRCLAKVSRTSWRSSAEHGRAACSRPIDADPQGRRRSTPSPTNKEATMPDYIIETSYHLPMCRRRPYSAETVEQACIFALGDEGWDGARSR